MEVRLFGPDRATAKQLAQKDREYLPSAAQPRMLHPQTTVKNFRGFGKVAHRVL